MQLVNMDAKNNKISPISTKTPPKKKDDGKNGIFWVRVSFLFAFYSLMLMLFYESVVDYIYDFGIWPRQGYDIVHQIVFTSVIIGMISGIIAMFKKKKLAWLAVFLNVLFCIINIIMTVTG